MRSLLCCAFLLVALPLSGQDMLQQAATQQNQDAINNATLASQQATQDSDMANQNAVEFGQQMTPGPAYGAYGADPYNEGFGGRAWRPQFNIKPGAYNAPIKVRLHERVHGAYLYYTTDGWSPTTPDGMRLTPYAHPYVGPIVINHDTRLQAVAVLPYGAASLVADAQYVFPPSMAAPTPSILSTDGVLHAGLKIPLVFAAPLDSSTAEVGDTALLHPAEDIQIDGHTYLPAQVNAEATVIHADRKGISGMPGELTVRVNSLILDGVTVPLHRTATCFGRDHYTRTLALLMIPVVGMAAIAGHGEDAQVVVGTPIVARVVADTRIPPAA